MRSLAAAADPVPVHRMAQLVEQRARALELLVVRTQTSGSAWSGGISPAMLLAYMRCTVAAMPALRQQVGPQGGDGEVGGVGQAFHRRLARCAATHAGTIAHHDDGTR